MITNKWTNGTKGEIFNEARAIRKEVFVEEQGFPEDAEFDAFDDMAMHVILYDDAKAIATGRVYHDGKTFRIGRIATKKEYRGQGLGDLLVKLLLLKAFEFSPSIVKVDAQKRLQAFYERYGFYADGDEFEDSGVVRAIPMSITKDTFVFKSKCGHDKTFWDFFEEKPPQE